MTSDTTHRLERLRNKLAIGELDAFLVSTPQNRLYLSGFNGSAGYLFITATNTFLITDFRYVEQATHQAPNFSVIQMRVGDQWFQSLLADHSIRCVGLEAQHLTVTQFKHCIISHYF